MKQIYSVTYPNGKIYIGKDMTGTLTYFGSVNNAIVAEDFSDEQKRDFTVRKEILFESEAEEEINRMECSLILKCRSNDPAIGYNRWPKLKERT